MASLTPNPFTPGNVGSRIGTLIQRDIIAKYDRATYMMKDKLFKVYINRVGILDSEVTDEADPGG